MGGGDAIWVAVMRPVQGIVQIIKVWSLIEMTRRVREVEFWLRRHADLRFVILRLPSGTRREQVLAAFDLLTYDEKLRLFNLRRRWI